MNKHPGILFYERNFRSLVSDYEAVSIKDIYGDLMKHLLSPPGAVLDIGAGSGRDAVWLSAQGYDVTAIEPAEGFRKFGQSRPDAKAITWLNDQLPRLSKTPSTLFDAIFMTAVVMHLSRQEIVETLVRLSQLMEKHCTLFFSNRHGPIPDGRHMFSYSDSLFFDLLNHTPLTMIDYCLRDDALGRGNVNWGCFVCGLVDD